MAGGHASGVAVLGSTIAITTLSTICTLTRLYTRLRIVRSFGLDDVCVTVAMIFSILMTIAMCEQVNYGLGQHITDLTPTQVKSALIWLWVSIWVYYIALGFVKCSILLQYLRIFPHNKVRTACFTLITIISVYTCWAVFSAVFACTPIDKFWDTTGTVSGHCLTRLPVWFTNAAVNIVTDICACVLPIPVLKSLNLSGRPKFALIVVFSLGGVTCIISILRLQSLYVISKAADVTYENPLAAIWSNYEVNVGIIASCLPTLKGFVSRFFPRIFPTLVSKSRPSIIEIGDLVPSNVATARIRSKARSQLDPEELEDEERVHQKDSKGIRVFTVLSQDVEHDSRSNSLSRVETESTSNLVRENPYRGV